MSKVRQKPARPKNFPLFPHGGGTWAKKIKGKHVHFGPWGKRDEAYEAYLDYERSAKFGRAAPFRPDGTIDLENLSDRFQSRQHDRTKAGEISLRTYKDLRSVIPGFVAVMGGETIVGELGPDHFARYRKSLGHLGQAATNRHIRLVRQMFRWGYDEGLFLQQPRYGQESMRKVSNIVRRRLREEQGGKLFAPADIRAIIDKAIVPMKAMIYLGINCGFGNTDCGELTLKAVDLKRGVIDFPRPKTNMPRRCILWPETVKALKAALAARNEPVIPEAKELFFVTKVGNPYVRNLPRMRDGQIEGVSVIDSLANVFAQTMVKAGLWTRAKAAKPDRWGKITRDGRSFYDLRHTFRTWADEVKDPHAVMRVMGHTFPGMSGVYVESISDERLNAVSDYVRSKLFSRTRSARQK